MTTPTPASVGVLFVGGCAQLLGDFTTTSIGKDASTPDVSDDKPVTSDVSSQDQVTPPPDTGPNCGQVGGQCCPNQPACQKGVCCGQTCFDVDNDPKNCGGCNQDCGGSNCVQGKCLPFELGATVEKDPTALVIDSGHAFFATINGNNGSVFDCPLTGCANPPAKVITGLAFAGDVVVNANTVFAPDNNNGKIHAINRGNLNDNSVTFQNPYAIDIDGVSLFLSSVSIPLQTKIDFTGTIPLNDGSNEGAMDIATDGNLNVFWSRSGNNQIRYGKANQQNAAGTFWNAGSLFTGTVAASKQFVAWMETDGNTGKSSVRSCPAQASTCAQAQTLDTGRLMGIRVGNIAVVQGDVYWTARDGFSKQVEVYRCPGAGCGGPPKLVATVTTNGTAVPGGVARPVGGPFVYFTFADATGTHFYRATDN